VFLGYDIPNYIVAITLLYTFSFHFDFFPMRGFSSDEFDYLPWQYQVLDIIKHATFPLITYIRGSFAVMTFMIKKALRNKLIPLVTHFGNNISII
jgi:microcin C transport system permease protein